MPNSSGILSHLDAVYEQNRNRSRNHLSIEDNETSSEVSEIQRPQQNTANALVSGAFGRHACFYGRQCNNIHQTSLSEEFIWFGTVSINHASNKLGIGLVLFIEPVVVSLQTSKYFNNI